MGGGAEGGGGRGGRDKCGIAFQDVRVQCTDNVARAMSVYRRGRLGDLFAVFAVSLYIQHTYMYTYIHTYIHT